MRDSTIVLEFQKVYRQLSVLGAMIGNDRVKGSILLQTLLDLHILAEADLKRTADRLAEEAKKEAEKAGVQ